jgi:hypothetical protein
VPPAAEGWDEANGYLGIAIGVLITVILLLITIILTILYKNLQQGRHRTPKVGQNNTEVHFYRLLSFFFSSIYNRQKLLNTNVAETLHLRPLCRGFIGPLDSVKNNFFRKIY